jgi:hypothetical protein
MNHDAERYDSGLLYASPASSQGTPNHTDSPMVETPWHSGHQQSPDGGPSSAQSPQIYPSVNRSADHIHYTSPSTSASYIPSSVSNGYTDPQHQLQPLSGQSDHDIQFTQIEGSIGPSRVQTRRQRAHMTAFSVGLRRASVSSHSNTPTGSQDTSEVGLILLSSYTTRSNFASRDNSSPNIHTRRQFHLHRRREMRRDRLISSIGRSGCL